ncbi:AraC family transcriptional regulator [Paraburkholderia acidicola]|nr:AraC family transcriptional regulator [Paraburkholderia acidicola]
MVEFYRVHGVEIGRVCAQDGASYPRHTHAEYVVSANLSGSEKIWVDGRNFDATSETVTVYNPHAVQSSTFNHREGGTDFISLYIEPSIIASIAMENSWLSRPTGPDFRQGVFNNNELYRSVLALYRTARDESDTDFEAALIGLVAALLMNGHRTIDMEKKYPDSERLKTVVEFMKSDLAAQMNLAALAEVGGVSKFHLIRWFKSVVGMPPAKYHMQLRLIEARRRLRDGQHVQDVAFALGFYDQSHFINAFRKIMGVSPLVFAAPLYSGHAGKPRIRVL